MATWSIIAIDRRTQQTGVITATCLDRAFFEENAHNFLEHSFTFVPCKGGIQAQAMIQDEKGPAATLGRRLLDAGTDPSEIIQAITTPELDGELIVVSNDAAGEPPYSEALYKLRQYGIVDFAGRAAGYTPPELTNLYEYFGFLDSEETSIQGLSGDYVYSVQGNIVADGVVNATGRAFENDADACDFVARLFAAIQAGMAAGGDVRCAPDIGAVLAFVKVVGPMGQVQIDLRVSVTQAESVSALDRLQELYSQWRVDHPCGSLSENSTYCDGATGNPAPANPSTTSSSSFHGVHYVLQLVVASSVTFFVEMLCIM